MPEVWIPPQAQKLTSGQQKVQIAGSTVRQVVDNLDKVYSGMKAWLCEEDEIMPGMAVIVDGEVSNIGMMQRVEEGSEIHFLPAIGGGTAFGCSRG